MRVTPELKRLVVRTVAQINKEKAVDNTERDQVLRWAGSVPELGLAVQHIKSLETDLKRARKRLWEFGFEDEDDIERGSIRNHAGARRHGFKPARSQALDADLLLTQLHYAMFDKGQRMLAEIGIKL